MVQRRRLRHDESMVRVDVYRYPHTETSDIWVAYLAARATVYDQDVIPRVEGPEPHLLAFDEPQPVTGGGVVHFRDDPQGWVRAFAVNHRHGSRPGLFAELHN
jgi:hypothetical protein